jgi:hypothetical protein
MKPKILELAKKLNIVMSKKTLVIIAFLFAGVFAKAQSKLALIVAIGEYENNSGWSSISSQNDVPLIKASLIKQGFAEKDILVLSDAAATKDGIMDAIKTHLIGKSTNDGIAVFHYSGHGQQIKDDNGDEIDGYDEALVSYNAKVRYQPGIYIGQNHIRDEELGSKMDELRLKLGSKGNVMVILDACHSGTGTRGGGKHRGTDKPLEPEGYAETVKDKKADNNGVTANPHSSDKMASMVGFFGASPHELNYETEDENGKGVGSLSYAFSKVFSNADKNSTYCGLFDKIKVEMSGFAPRQTPQAEGDLDYTILGGKIAGKLNYFKVEKWNGDKEVVINGGELLGLFTNTKVAFYPIDTKDVSKAKPKATGIVTSSTFTNSVVTLDGPLDKTAALGSWIFVTEKNYGSLEIKVKLEVSNDALKNAILGEFAKYPFIKTVKDGVSDIIVDEGNTHSRGSQIKLTSANDAILLEEAVNSNLALTAESVVDKVKSFSQASYIRGLDVTDAKMDVSFEFIPIETVTDGDKVKEKSRGDIKSKIDETGVMTFKAEEAYKIKITNNGTKPLYFSIIDIQPDNVINLVVPNESTGRLALDYRINPGETKELGDDDIIVFYPPTGNEVFKLIATETPLDLSSIIKTRGESSRGEKDANPFSVLFSESFKEGGSRGPKMPNVPQGSANVYTVTFKIVE